MNLDTQIIELATEVCNYNFHVCKFQPRNRGHINILFCKSKLFLTTISKLRNIFEIELYMLHLSHSSAASRMKRTCLGKWYVKNLITANKYLH